MFNHKQEEAFKDLKVGLTKTPTQMTKEILDLLNENHPGILEDMEQETFHSGQECPETSKLAYKIVANVQNSDVNSNERRKVYILCLGD